MSPTPRALKIKSQVRSRVKNNGVKVEIVLEILECVLRGRCTVSHLLKFARLIAKKLNIRVDTLANRSRAALICWYAENWEDAYPYIMNIDSLIEEDKRIIRNKSKTIRNPDKVDPSDIYSLLNYH